MQHAGQARSFLEAVNDNFWIQQVGEWAHLQETAHPSRLDSVFATAPIEIEDIKYLPQLGLSKHVALCFNFLAESKLKEGGLYWEA